MKKSLCFLISTLVIISLLIGCKKSENYIFYDYNMDDYVTLGEYKGVKVEANSAEFQSLLNTRYHKDMDELNLGVSEEVKDRAVENLDTVHIVYVGKLNGVAFEGGSSGDEGYDLQIGSGTFIPGFESGLIGAKLGETVDVPITFPENYQSKDLAGKPVVFTITVQKITKKVYPELTDEIAQKLEYSSLVEYKATAFDELKQGYVWNKIMHGSKAKKYPEKEMQYFIDSTIEDVTTYVEAQGGTLKQYLDMKNLTLENLKSNIKNSDEINSTLLEEMVVYAIAQKEELTVTKEELTKKLSEYPKNDGTSYTDKEKANISRQLLMEKVLNFTVDKSVDV